MYKHTLCVCYAYARMFLFCILVCFSNFFHLSLSLSLKNCCLVLNNNHIDVNIMLLFRPKHLQTHS